LEKGRARRQTARLLLLIRSVIRADLAVRAASRGLGLETTRPRCVYNTKLNGIYLWEEAMGWFGQKTSIAGIEISNWVLVVAAIVVIWIIYRFIA
jgi:hypothetical protein